MNKRRSKFILGSFVFGTILCDQGTKFLAEIYLPQGSINCGGWLSFSLAHNTGCAWSLLPDRAPWLAILGIIFVGILLWKRHFFGVYERPVTFGLLLGGVLSNALDRFYRGFVIDFVNINLQIYHWPAFNVADASLCLAAFSLLFLAPKISDL
ncbi:MAG: signal peptidase II [Puniceicoccales bacterium]|nr:signal peptidase II [Puniceicoccales bacterium]